MSYDFPLIFYNCIEKQGVDLPCLLNSHDFKIEKPLLDVSVHRAQAFLKIIQNAKKALKTCKQKCTPL